METGVDGWVRVFGTLVGFLPVDALGDSYFMLQRRVEAEQLTALVDAGQNDVHVGRVAEQPLFAGCRLALFAVCLDAAASALPFAVRLRFLPSVPRFAL